MKVVLNEKSLIGIKENGKTKLLRDYLEFVKVDEIQVGKENFKITARMELSENNVSRIHLQLKDYQSKVYTASIIPMFDGKNTFLKFGNKMLATPQLFLMNLLPSIHLLADSQKAELQKALDRKLSASEKEHKEQLEKYDSWKIEQITKFYRKPSNLESLEEWLEIEEAKIFDLQTKLNGKGKKAEKAKEDTTSLDKVDSLESLLESATN